MTDIYENKIQVKNTLLMFLENFYAVTKHNSVDAMTMLASVMYLQKKDALCIKFNANEGKDTPIWRIDANILKTSGIPKSHIHFNSLDLCSTLSANDPLYFIINYSDSSLLRWTDISKAVTDTIKYIVSGIILPEQYVDILDGLTKDNREIYKYEQPKEFSLLAKMLVNVEGKTVFNPFSGLMSFASVLDGYSEYTGMDFNGKVYDYAMIRLGLADKIDNIIRNRINLKYWADEKYDLIVTNPPFGLKLSMEDALANGQEDSSTVALRRFEETTSKDGQLFTFVHPSILSSPVYSSLREELTAKNYLDAVICLPEGILTYTSIPLSVVILKKNRESGSPIKMIDASQMFTGTRPRIISVDEIFKSYTEDTDKTLNVSADDIASKHYSWDALYYNAISTETFRNGYDVKALSDILVPFRGDRSFSETEGKCVKVSNFPSDWSNYVLNVEDIPASDSLRNTQKITIPVLLLTMSGKDIKVAFCEASEKNPIFVGSNVNAYTLSTSNIHIGYLFMELSKKIIPSTGSTIPHLNKYSLAMIRIGFPPLSDSNSYNLQANLYEEAKSAMILSKANELGLQKVIETMKADYINEIRTRKHDMMPHLRQLTRAQDNLKYYLEHKEQFSDKEFISSIKEEIFNQEGAIESLSSILKVFSRESQFGTPEVINLDKYLMDHYFDGDNYLVDYDTDYEALANYGFDIPDVYLNFNYTHGHKASIDAHPDYVEGINTYIAEDDLKRLCDNIVFNAIKHGFTDPSRNDYGLLIELTVDQKRDMFQIDFRNNGNPLPKGMDKLRYGLKGEKAGVTGGTGEGGYIVKSITEHYGGDYDIFCENHDNVSLTTVRVFLPIYRDNE